ncbi:MAG: redoxin family protein [Isosphaeraceae bacterium]|nr:redoxin family protein [Isosphaeraceae bacterium]
MAYLATSSANAGDILNLGDPAPPLAVSSWVKGDKVEKFEPGKTYVIEFWATWCGPCLESIPHLTELAHQYKDKGVRFIGVDVWEQDTALVPPFVKEMGDKMDYSVALDSVTDKGDPKDGAMAKAWMNAAEEDGIPTAFIVRDGTIAWIGHPMKMDEPLAKITAGDWDPKADAGERLVKKTKEKKIRVIRQKVYKPLRARDYKATLAAIEEVTASEPELAGEFELSRFIALANSGDVDAALPLGTKLVDAHPDDLGILNGVAWGVVDLKLKKDPDPRLIPLALKAARRADKVSKGASMILDTLAVALYRSGDPAAAILAEEKALEQLEAEDTSRTHPYFKLFDERLALFRKAAKVKAERP